MPEQLIFWALLCIICVFMVNAQTAMSAEIVKEFDKTTLDYNIIAEKDVVWRVEATGEYKMPEGTKEVIVMKDNKVVDIKPVDGTLSLGKDNYLIEYKTPPTLVLRNSEADGEKIEVTAPELGYTKVLMKIPLLKHSYSPHVKVYEITYDTVITGDCAKNCTITKYEIQRTPISVQKLDENNDGLVESVEWVIPHMSDHIFKLVIELINAEELDDKRIFIRNVFNQTRYLDNRWTGLIEEGHYIRARFAQNLTQYNDITVYARGDGVIHIFEVNGTKEITSIKVSGENTYKELLTGFENTNSIFDLQIEGKIDLDFIVDPAAGCDLTYLKKNTVSAWHMGESTTPIKNAINRANTNLSEGAITGTAVGLRGNGTDFERTSANKLRTKQTTAFELNGSFTWSIWYWQESGDTAKYAPIIYHFSSISGTDYGYYCIQTKSATTPQLSCTVTGNANTVDRFVPSRSFFNNAWNLITFRWNGQDLRACINGQCAGTMSYNQTSSIKYLHNNMSLAVGGAYTGTGWSTTYSNADGIFDEFHYFNVSLNQSCINFLNASGSPGWNTTYPFYNETSAPSNSCSCPSPAANWVINMSHHCNITSNCNIGNYVLNFTSAVPGGYANISQGVVINISRLIPPPLNTILWIQRNVLIALRHI